MKKILSIIMGLTLVSCSTPFVSHSQRKVEVKYKEIKSNVDAVNANIIRIKDTDGTFICTGFVLDGHYAATAGHCISKMNGAYSRSKFRIYNSRDEFVTLALAFGTNHRMDYGILVGDFTSFVSSTLMNNYDSFYVGKFYGACGYPMGQKELFCTPLQAIGSDIFLMRMRGVLYPGMSGGVVIDMETNSVVGINSRVTGDVGYVAVSPVVGLLGAFELQ